MNKKYYADIILDYTDIKHTIACEVGSKRQEIMELVSLFAKKQKLICNLKTKKFFDSQGKEVGYFEITSINI
jgi:hypothetical protein